MQVQNFALINTVQAWLAAKTSAEKKRLFIVVSIVLTLLIYLLLWQPLQSSKQLLQQQIENRQQQLSQLLSLNRQLTAMSADQSLSWSVQLSVPLSAKQQEQQIRQFMRRLKLNNKDLRSSGQGWMVELSSVEFNPLLGGLSDLAKRGVAIQSLDISVSDRPGKVTGTLSFSLPGQDR